nr:nickel-dependent lactate racemase [Paenibacillus lutrae]
MRRVNFQPPTVKLAVSGKNKCWKDAIFVKLQLCYGTEQLNIFWPEDRPLRLITPALPDPLPDEAIHNALRSPTGCLPLRQLAAGKRSAVILISDGTRLSPSERLLPPLLEELSAAGIPDDAVTVLVALGTHRQQSESELRRLTGDDVYERVRVLNHSSNTEDCVHVGTTSRGTPIELNRAVVEAGMLIITGNIEPHLLVGSSGGVKALMPGAASRRCIERHHALSKSYKAEPGCVDNPLHRDLEEALRFVPAPFLLNTVVDMERRLLGVFAGDVALAHTAGVKLANSAFLVRRSRLYDAVIVSAGGYPKDAQLYQAVKTLTNAAAFVKKGGRILLVARCQELYGHPKFAEAVEDHPDRKKLLQELSKRFVLGAHKLEQIHTILQEKQVFLYSDVPAPLVELIGFKPVASLEETIAGWASDADADIAFMPYGGLTFSKTE